jgi:hypothetical protein
MGAYQVVWKDCNVFNADGKATTLGRGDYVPEWVDEVQKSQLATFGAVRFVDVGLTPLEDIPAMMVAAPFATDSDPDDPDQDPVGFVDTSKGVPSGSPLSGQDPNTEPLVVSGGDGPDNPDDPADPKADQKPDAAEAEDNAPSKYATKPEWEDYAVQNGMSREDAENATKAELIAKFGG